MTQMEEKVRRRMEEVRTALTWVRAHAGLVMAAILLLAAALWLAGHDAQIRREAELGQMRRETAAEVAALRSRAEGAMKEFRASERMIRDLESRRAGLEREAAALRARLAFLREEERARVRAAATLGHTNVSGRVALRPDPARQPPEIRASDAAGGAQEFQIQDSGFQRVTPGSYPGGERPRVLRGEELEGTGSNGPRGADDARGTGEAALGSCREQSAVQDRLISNCEERAELNRGALEAAKRSALELGEALRAKDAIAARMAEQHRAELKVARGSRLRRMGRALEYVGVGVVIGIVVAR